jgi:Co/Zn/Cd efflux system component
MEKRHGRIGGRIENAIEALVERGWVVQEENLYALTPRGRREGEKVLADMRRTGSQLHKLAQPQTASQVGLGVHLALAALKLPAALFSGSVGLLNDATDTALDGLSSILVCLGLRFEKERAANVVLVLLMLITGGYTLYEAGRRLFVPVEPEADWFTFVAALLSALVCLALGLYQRFVGIRSGSLALVTQSVDSRNHVITALSVTAGLIAALLRFPLLDTLVGLAVALLILQSAIELAIELIRSLDEQEPDLDRYQMRLAKWAGKFRKAQLGDWMLYMVENQHVQTREELVARAHEVLDLSGNPTLRELGVRAPSQASDTIEECLAELLAHRWLNAESPLCLTDAGRTHLKRQMGKKRQAAVSL